MMKKYLLILGILLLATPAFAGEKYKQFNTSYTDCSSGCLIDFEEDATESIRIDSYFFQVSNLGDSAIIDLALRCTQGGGAGSNRWLVMSDTAVGELATGKNNFFFSSPNDLGLVCNPNSMYFYGDLNSVPGVANVGVSYDVVDSYIPRSSIVGGTTFGIATLIFLGSFVALGLGFNTFLSRRRSAHAYG